MTEKNVVILCVGLFLFSCLRTSHKRYHIEVMYDLNRLVTVII